MASDINVNNSSNESQRNVLENDLEFHKRANAILEDFLTEIQVS